MFQQATDWHTRKPELGGSPSGKGPG